MHSKNRGFTLLEILIVLALIGLVATIILPALRTTTKYAMREAIQNLSSQITQTYDNALFTGRVHRMVFDVQRGRIWTEIAPTDFIGRAPIISEESEARKKFKESLYNKLVDQARNAEATKNPLLEIPAHQREQLKDVPWDTLKTSLIEPKQLTGNVVFVQISTGFNKYPIQFPLNYIATAEAEKAPANPEYLAYVYFFPSAIATPISIQLGFRDNSTIDTNAPKYTLNFNTLTGRLNLQEGFQEANFELPN